MSDNNQYDDQLDTEKTALKTLAQIEHSIIKKFRPTIWRKFIRALQDFDLVQDGDHIAVAISGGKDSLLLAKLLQELKRHGQSRFELSFIAMDPGFSTENRLALEQNAAHLGLALNIYDSNIFTVVDNIAGNYPCYLCAKMRRGFLYERAKELGANKLALGHHFDDVVETIMMNVLYAGTYMTMMPILNSQNFADMQLIRPLYYVEEHDIIKWANYNGIVAMNCGCAVAAKKVSSKRYEVKQLIAKLKANSPDVAKSILRSSQNVHLDAILGFKRRGQNYSYKDYYDRERFEL